jgi:hypothetical protein
MPKLCGCPWGITEVDNPDVFSTNKIATSPEPMFRIYLFRQVTRDVKMYYTCTNTGVHKYRAPGRPGDWTLYRDAYPRIFRWLLDFWEIFASTPPPPIQPYIFIHTRYSCTHKWGFRQQYHSIHLNTQATACSVRSQRYLFTVAVSHCHCLSKFKKIKLSLHTPQRHTAKGEWKYNSTHSQYRQCEVSQGTLRHPVTGVWNFKISFNWGLIKMKWESEVTYKDIL